MIGRRAFAGLLAAMPVAAVTACAPTPSRRASAEDSARRAVVRYLTAVAAGDLATATAMTDPRALVMRQPENTPRTDVTAALPQAQQPLRDPWVAALGEDTVFFPESSPTPGGYVTGYRFQVSYRVGEGTGSDIVAVTSDESGGTGPWRVTDPLLLTAVVQVDRDHVPALTVGGVRIAGSATAVHVWGYPGVYLAEAVDLPDGFTADPFPVHLGVEIPPPWNDSLPRLEAVSTESEGG